MCRGPDAVNEAPPVSDYSATGQLMLRPSPPPPPQYIPERSKQQGLRLPLASMSQAAAMRLTRVSAFLAETIQ